MKTEKVHTHESIHKLIIAVPCFSFYSVLYKNGGIIEYDTNNPKEQSKNETGK